MVWWAPMSEDQARSDGIASEWLSLPEVMRLLGVGRTTLYRWMDQGRLPFYVPPSVSGAPQGRRRFRRADVEAFMRRVDVRDRDDDGGAGRGG